MSEPPPRRTPPTAQRRRLAGWLGVARNRFLLIVGR